MRDVVSTEDVCKKKVKDAVSFLEEDEQRTTFPFSKRRSAMFTPKEDDVKFLTSYLRMRNL